MPNRPVKRVQAANNGTSNTGSQSFPESLQYLLHLSNLAYILGPMKLISINILYTLTQIDTLSRSGLKIVAKSRAGAKAGIKKLKKRDAAVDLYLLILKNAKFIQETIHSDGPFYSSYGRKVKRYTITKEGRLFLEDLSKIIEYYNELKAIPLVHLNRKKTLDKYTLIVNKIKNHTKILNVY